VAGEVSLFEQVTRFLHDVGPGAPADALFVIEMGGNDIRDALFAAFTGGDAGAILGQAVSSIVINIARLHQQAGARKFLVWRAPNVGRAPAIQFFGPAGVQAATQFSIGFNDALDNALASPYIAALPAIELVRFDAFGAIEDLATRPAAYGLSDAKTACINPLVAPYQCQRPDRYFFWDGIHPTRAGHGIIALLVGKTLIAHELAD
jgi:outer membrane lipase/esterase